jgi:HTH-type transcriptional regulator/antitoxin HigA
MTEASLAAAIGLAEAGEILDGRAPIGPEVALGLELALGIPARFWNNAERQYRDGIKEGPGQDRESPQPNRHRRPAKWK